MSALGILFVLVVLGDSLVRAQSPWDAIFAAAGWLIWGVFVAEFAARLLIAPSKGRFLRRNWWQALFLVLPFLRFVRLVAAARVTRVGRVLSSAISGGRTAGEALRSRLGWLVSLTVIVILAASQLLYELAGFERYGEALHRAAYGAITGEPVGRDGAAAQIIEIALAVYSVVVFASLAGILGAYFLDPNKPLGRTSPTSSSQRL